MANFSSMMSFFPALLGILIVLQAGLNRKIAGAWGLPSAAFLNALVLTVVAAVAVAVMGTGSSQPLELKAAKWWYLIPGVIGFALVFGGPWAIARWGAVHTFVLVVTAQLVGSMVWDLWVEGIPVTRMRVLGILVAWVGVFLTTLK